ncbi:MAG: c-type cytochrome [Acidimicrobiia bacterium]|nr:c-type cytochrome [Acidimicrobiia bacterium]
MRFLLILCAAAGMFAAPDPKLAAAGRIVYNRACTMCHGLDGAVGDRAPALGAQRRYLRRSSQELFNAIKLGIPGTLMPPTPLSDLEVNQIAAFIQSLRATAADVEVPGNTARGEAIFHGKGQCTECHTIRGRGGIIGPDLSDVGGYLRLEELRAALTTPKESIPRGFRPVRLTTASGEVIDGVVKNENNFSLQILTRDGGLKMMLREEAREITYPEQSLMPAGYDKKLTSEEFQDLLAFLSRQSRRPRP